MYEDGRPTYLVHDKMYCFHRSPRPDALDPETGERLEDVFVFRVADLDVKELIVGDPRGIFFTTPHWNGYAAVLMRIPNLARIDREELAGPRRRGLAHPRAEAAREGVARRARSTRRRGRRHPLRGGARLGRRLARAFILRRPLAQRGGSNEEARVRNCAGRGVARDAGNDGGRPAGRHRHALDDRRRTRARRSSSRLRRRRPPPSSIHSSSSSTVTAGTRTGTSIQFHIQTLWPQAIVVYPQGLNTPTPVDPSATQSGLAVQGRRLGRP